MGVTHSVTTGMFSLLGVAVGAAATAGIVAKAYVILRHFRAVRPGARLPDTQRPEFAIAATKDALKALEPWTHAHRRRTA
jgi:hypothetical protein